MASPEETKETLLHSNTRPGTNTNRKTINSDYIKAKEITNDNKYNKSFMTTSKSEPTFHDSSKFDCEEPDYRSESDLHNVTINESSLLVSQSYQSHGGQQKQNAAPLSPGQLKVQFAETENKRKQCDTQSCAECDAKYSAQNTFGKSPSKKKRQGRQASEVSSVSLASDNSASSTSTSFSVVAPDGGFGWVVVAASFFVNMIADGVTFSFGIMFEEFQNEFGSSSAATAGVVSMFHAVPLMTGPIATWLADRYGCRAVTIVGAILAATGFLAAAFSHHIALLYFFFGVISGFGLSLCYVASIIIVAYYFDRRRSFATGISVCGSGVGTFLFAPFTQWLMDSYGGWRGACIILAGIFLNMIVCGMMFKELDWKKNKRMNHTSSTKSLASQMPEIEELRHALESGDVSVLLHQDDKQQKFASSLITIPTYIKDASKLPEDVLSMIVHNEKTYDYIVHNFPESLIAQSMIDLELGSCEIPEEESAGVKLKRRMSSILKGQISTRMKQENKEKQNKAISNVRDTNNDVQWKQVSEAKIQRISFLQIRRQSMICRGDHFHSPRYQMKSSSCPDIYKHTSVDKFTEREDWAKSMDKCCSLKYVTLPFLVFCFSNFLLYFWYDVPYVYTIEYAEKILQVPNSDSAQILSVIGVLNTIGEVLVGWLSDQPWMSSITLYSICMCVCGFVTALIPFVNSYNAVLVLSAFYGFCISANYSLTSPILVDLVSIDNFSSAYGFLLACQGVGNLIGPPFAGWLYDFSKEWFLTFGLAGFFIAISGLLLVIIPSSALLKRYLQKVNLNQRVKTHTNYKPREKSIVYTGILADE